jgi:GAF domain-containing protein
VNFVSQPAALQRTAELLAARRGALLERWITAILQRAPQAPADEVRALATESLEALLEACAKNALAAFLFDEKRFAREAARAGKSFEVRAAAILSFAPACRELLLESPLLRSELAACLGVVADLTGSRMAVLLEAQQDEAARRSIELEDHVETARERTRELLQANAALRRAEARSQRRAEQVALLASVIQRVAGVLDPERLMQEAAETIRSRMGHTYVAVVVLDDEGVLVGRWAGRPGVNRRGAGRAQAPPRGIIGRALRKRAPQVAGDVTVDPDYHPDVPGTRSELVVPLIDETQAVGVIDFQSEKAAAFDLEDVVAAEAIAEFLVIALRNARLFAASRAAGA